MNFNSKTVFITGGTGFIGSHLIRTLITSDANIICYGRDIEKIRNKYGSHVTAVDTFDVGHTHIDYIIHAACPTASSELATEPVEVISSIYDGSKSSLELAKKTSARYIFLSSMEVYDGLNGEVHEDTIGKCNLLNSRSAYPMGKQLAEMLVNSYHNEYNVNTVIVRLAQVFGPGAAINDNRFFNFAIKKCLENKPIVLHTTGVKWHNSCFIDDAVFYILQLLLTDEHGIFNVVTPEYCNNINSLTDEIIKILSSKSEVKHNIMACTEFRPDCKYNMSNCKIKKMFPEYQPETFGNAIIKTAEYFKRLLTVS